MQGPSLKIFSCLPAGRSLPPQNRLPACLPGRDLPPGSSSPMKMVTFSTKKEHLRKKCVDLFKKCVDFGPLGDVKAFKPLLLKAFNLEDWLVSPYLVKKSLWIKTKLLKLRYLCIISNKKFSFMTSKIMNGCSARLREKMIFWNNTQLSFYLLKR